MTSASAPGTDFAAVTARQQRMWATGDFHRIGVAQVGVGERLVRSLRVRAGDRVLDVAAGAGNTALAAARRFAEVVATDYVPDLLGHARARAAAEGITLATEVADAQALPYDDATFDVVTSTFGAMFAPDQERTASELLRMLRPGGRLGMANWTPTGFVGEMFAIGARHVPPSPGLQPAARWGTPQGLDGLLGRRGAELTVRERSCDFVYPSREFMLDYFRSWFGPTATQFAALDIDGQQRLADDLLSLYAKHNTADDGTVLIAGTYLEVVATKP
ncbi:MAG: class I SAM-dependent methyltransferase [Mycobacteriales bacterium]|nr:methyltransferase domain-containing protein [Frankia sp.]